MFMRTRRAIAIDASSITLGAFHRPTGDIVMSKFVRPRSGGWRHICSALAGVPILSSMASAQWSVVNLHPTGASQSNGLGVGDGQQVGFALGAGSDAAALWSGTAASWVNLHPANATISHAFAAAGGQQVGDAFVKNQLRASLWTGSAATWVDLSPAGTFRSQAAGVFGGQQVGYARIGLFDHAGFWTGSAASWTDLHPAAADFSTALATRGGMQVGQAFAGGALRASLWSGSAASWVDLHPSGIGSTGSSALATDATRQVGYAAGVGGHTSHACMWSGTAGSFVDLNPAGSTESQALGIAGNVQVGYVRIAAGPNVASLWRGTAASWENLEAALPGTWSSSRAEAASVSGAVISVVGNAFNVGTGRREAVLWTRPLCYPNCDGSTGLPTLTANDFQCFINKFAANDGYANCDGSTTAPTLTPNDFICFISAYAAGCP
jgi:hypothetical protein